jgi:hypothetical protein
MEVNDEKVKFQNSPQFDLESMMDANAFSKAQDSACYSERKAEAEPVPVKFEMMGVSAINNVD